MTAELLNKATDEILDSETLNDGPVTEKHIRNFNGIFWQEGVKQRGHMHNNQAAMQTRTQAHNIGPHCSAIKDIIVYLALQNMGPSTDR